jgi:hypothetical protein
MPANRISPPPPPIDCAISAVLRAPVVVRPPA